MHDLTDEEKALLLSGDLTEEEALAIIKESQGSKTDQTNSGEYNDRVYDLVAQIYLLRSKFTGELANQIGSMDSTSIVNELKLMLDQTKLMTDDEIRVIIYEISGR